MPGKRGLTKSEQMSRVRTRNTAPEVKLRRALWHEGYRYRKHPPVPGKPDFVFTSARLAVFVDGCFWHGCPDHGSLPATNREFWERKLARNVARDLAVTEQLQALGWRVLRIWEHTIERNLDTAVEDIRRVLSESRKPQVAKTTGDSLPNLSNDHLQEAKRNGNNQL